MTAQISGPTGSPTTAGPDRLRFGRLPDRGSTSIAAARDILDGALVGHVGIVAADGWPSVLPVAIARRPGSSGRADDVLIHGSTGSRLFRALSEGAPTCLTVTHLDGLVLARSGFHSSMNYRSLMVYGTAQVQAGQPKWDALKLLIEHLTPGRLEQLRPMTNKEVAATAVLALPLVDFTVKARAGGPTDADEDGDRDIWAGELPLETNVGRPRPAPGLAPRPPENWLAVAPVVHRPATG